MGQSGQKWSGKNFSKIFFQCKTTYNDSEPPKTWKKARKKTRKRPKTKIQDTRKSRFFDHTDFALMGPKSRWPDLREILSVWANFSGGFLRWLEELFNKFLAQTDEISKKYFSILAQKGHI